MDQYEILRELGRGGTSVVYLVTDRADGRNYAMKTLREDCGNKPEDMRRKRRLRRICHGICGRPIPSANS